MRKNKYHAFFSVFLFPQIPQEQLPGHNKQKARLWSKHGFQNIRSTCFPLALRAELTHQLLPIRQRSWLKNLSIPGLEFEKVSTSPKRTNQAVNTTPLPQNPPLGKPDKPKLKPPPGPLTLKRTPNT